MKKIVILTVLLNPMMFLFGQSADVELSTGSGKTYFFESIDKNVEVNYGLPLSIMSEFKYTPQNNNWGVKIRLQHVESSITGTNWTDQTLLDGYIRSFSAFVLLENELPLKRH